MIGSETHLDPSIKEGLTAYWKDADSKGGVNVIVKSSLNSVESTSSECISIKTLTFKNLSLSLQCIDRPVAIYNLNHLINNIKSIVKTQQAPTG